MNVKDRIRRLEHMDLADLIGDEWNRLNEESEIRANEGLAFWEAQFEPESDDLVRAIGDCGFSAGDPRLQEFRKAQRGLWSRALDAVATALSSQSPASAYRISCVVTGYRAEIQTFVTHLVAREGLQQGIASLTLDDAGEQLHPVAEALKAAIRKRQSQAQRSLDTRHPFVGLEALSAIEALRRTEDARAKSFREWSQVLKRTGNVEEQRPPPETASDAPTADPPYPELAQWLAADEARAAQLIDLDRNVRALQKFAAGIEIRLQRRSFGEGELSESTEGAAAVEEVAPLDAKRNLLDNGRRK